MGQSRLHPRPINNPVTPSAAGHAASFVMCQDANTQKRRMQSNHQSEACADGGARRLRSSWGAILGAGVKGVAVSLADSDFCIIRDVAQHILRRYRLCNDSGKIYFHSCRMPVGMMA